MIELKHYIQESFIGITRNWKAAAAAAVIVCMSIILLGFLLFIKQTTAHVYGYVEQQLSIKLYVNEQYDSQDVFNIVNNLTMINDVELISGTEQLNQLNQFFQDKPELLDVFTEGGIPDAISFKVNELAHMTKIVNYFNEQPSIAYVAYPQQFASQVVQWSSAMERYGLALFLVFVCVSFVIVFIATQLAMQQRKKEVQLKLLLGANPKLVTLQFMMEGLWIGLIASVVGALFVQFTSTQITIFAKEAMPALFLSTEALAGLSLFGLIMFGPLFSMLAAYFATRGRV